MSKQEKLISADKLVEWLEEVFKAHITMHQTERSHAYKDVLTEIKSGKFSADPVPTIKPGDMVIHDEYEGIGIVIDSYNGKSVVDFDEGLFEVADIDLEVVKDE